MSKTLRSIRAVVPYPAPGIRAEYLRINVELDRLTIFVGPNASGKTTVLESIGYILSSLLKPAPSSLGLALTATLRPKRTIPSPVGGMVLLDDTRASSMFIKPDPFLLMTGNQLEEMTRYSMGQDAKILLDEIRRDINAHSDILLELHDTFKKGIYEHRREAYRALIEIITNILGHNIDLEASSPIRGTKYFSIEGEETEETDISVVDDVVKRYIFLSHKVKILYILFNGNIIEKAIITNGLPFTVVIKKRHSRIMTTPNIIVFHPGFIYWRGVFERLYYTYVYKGLPNEREAVNLLKKYITWIDGYELVGHELHVKSSNGRRISVYNLSDGQRVAVFISLLYAVSKPPVLILIDTPEAFVHPDGLPVVADFITRLVVNGNQVAIATQSIEFLRKMLNRAKEYNILEDTLVERIELSENGLIEAKGKWRGEVSLRSIESLGLDLRK
ncbi:MAG: ATP-binding protein [Caldisphaeraceae archaeon]|nr:ATP-binding protein [Caldisphaeraceae archaeon]MEB3798561.1 ATP-binding protein [Caldisphaeraceae archaeon]